MFLLWWYDASADALLHSYRHQTQLIFPANSINSVADSRLSPGDMAITADGIHVLSYLGKNRWIEADPNAMKVIVVPVPSADYWFRIPVVMVKWTDF